MKKLLTAFILLQTVWANPIHAEDAMDMAQLEQTNKEPILIPDGRFVKGRTLVPAKSVFEALGAEVSWNSATRTVTIVGDKTISVAIDSKVAIVDGVEYLLDVPAQIVNGRTMVPIRFISENLGAQVDWDQENQLATIRTPEVTILVAIDPILKTWDIGPKGYTINEQVDLNGDGQKDTLSVTGGKGTTQVIIASTKGQNFEFRAQPDNTGIVSTKMMLADLNRNGNLQLLEIQKNQEYQDYYLDVYTFLKGEFELVAGLVPIQENYSFARGRMISGDKEYVFNGSNLVEVNGSVVGEVEEVTEEELNRQTQQSTPSGQKQSETFNGKTVVEGMTRDQVYAVLGAPSEIKPDLESQELYKKLFGFESPMIQWNYIQGSGYQTEILAVVFIGGKVQSFVHHLPID